MYFDVLWPNSENYVTENAINNNSLICKMNYKSFSMIFTGDIEEIAEVQILKEYANTNMLKSTILKVAHHGSKTSSIQEFIQKVDPKVALIGVGENNTFGHPNEDVLERLKKWGAKIYKTNTDGEISIVVNKKGRIKVKKILYNKSKICK